MQTPNIDQLANVFNMRPVEAQETCCATHRFETEKIPPDLELRCLCGEITWGDEYMSLVRQVLRRWPKWMSVNMSSRFTLHG